MDAMMWFFVLSPLLVPLALLFFHALRPVNCPDCGATLPIIGSPFEKTRRSWRAGGYLCAQCGCEIDAAGRKVTANTPPAPFPALQCALLAVFFFIAVGLVSVALMGPAMAEPPAVAEPPVVAFPPRAPAAPAN